MADDNTEFLIEYRVVGNSVKVSAVDPVTLTEVTIVGPLSAGKEELMRNAVNKLKYVLEKQKPDPEPPPRRPGKLV